MGSCPQVWITHLYYDYERPLRILSLKYTQKNIKPENVLYRVTHNPHTGQREVNFYLSDFGLLSMSHDTAGTPGYMAPEVLLRGEEGSVSNKTDMYAFGVTLIRILGLFAPFDFKQGIEWWASRFEGSGIPRETTRAYSWVVKKMKFGLVPVAVMRDLGLIGKNLQKLVAGHPSDRPEAHEALELLRSHRPNLYLPQNGNW